MDGIIILLISIWAIAVIIYLFKRKKNGCGISCVGCASAPTCNAASTLVERYHKDHPRTTS